MKKHLSIAIIAILALLFCSCENNRSESGSEGYPVTETAGAATVYLTAEGQPVEVETKNVDDIDAGKIVPGISAQDYKARITKKPIQVRGTRGNIGAGLVVLIWGTYEYMSEKNRDKPKNKK